MNEETLLKGIQRLKRRRDFLLEENRKLEQKIRFLEFRLKRTKTLLRYELEDKNNEFI